MNNHFKLITIFICCVDGPWCPYNSSWPCNFIACWFECLSHSNPIGSTFNSFLQISPGNISFITSTMLQYYVYTICALLLKNPNVQTFDHNSLHNIQMFSVNYVCRFSKEYLHFEFRVFTCHSFLCVCLFAHDFLAIS